MTVVNIATGEVVDTMGAAEARRLTTEAREQFRTASDHADRGWDLIEQAVKGGGHFDLGYKSPGEYLRAEFEGTLRGLEVETRRRAVQTMTDWGLSSRAIAPVVGITDRQVRYDNKVGSSSHLPQTSCATSDTPADPEDAVAAAETAEGVGSERPSDPAPRPPVVGIDGKTYPATTRRQPARPRPIAETSLNTIESYADRAAREAKKLTADQIRRVKPNAAEWIGGIRESIEVLSDLIRSLEEN